MRCPACGQPTPLHGYPLPDRKGERVRILIDVRVSPGPAYTPRLVPAGSLGTVTGMLWPRGYAIALADGSGVILPADDFIAVAP